MQCLKSLYLAVHTILKATCLFLLEVSHNLLQALVFLKIAEPNVQKPLDESNEIIMTIWWGWLCISTSNLWPAWSAPLRIWAQLVVSSTAISSKVESSNTNVTLLGATKYPVFFPLFVHGLTKAFLENSPQIFSQHRASVLISELEIIMWRFLLISS